MRVRVLGPLEVWDDGRELPLGSGRQRALFVLLLLHADEVVSRDRLIDELWGERPPASAAKVLQGYVSQLRRRLPPESIVTRGSGYLLRGGGTDASEFERLVERARKEDAREAALTLRDALALWRGGALAEVEYEAWAQAEIARLEELRLVAIEERIEVDLRLGEDAHVVPELEALVAAHPLRERPRAQLMLALYRAGRQTGALDAFAAARRRLVDELGVEPGTALRELHHAILRQDPALELPAQAATVGSQSLGAFVAREAELAQLVTGLDDAIAGRGRLFLFVGEPGIGKSRLAEELIQLARARRVEVLVGRCWEAGGAPAYWPWVQALRAHVGGTEPERLRAQLGRGGPDLAQLVPELRELFPDLPEPQPLVSESARFRLFEAVASLLRSAAETCPIVLVLDDLHAADEPSLLLLRFLGRELGSSRLLVVGAYRDVDPIPADPLTTTVTELARERTVTSLVLSGLAEGDVARFIELIAGEPASQRLAANVHEETQGNPLFVGEIVRLLAAEGRLDGEKEPRLAVPPTVRDVIARRLRHLSDACNRVLVLASVLGPEFGLDALSRLGELTDDELLETLDEAMVARVVSNVPDDADRLRFAHTLIRDSLYEGLTTVRRVRLHRLAVEALEALYGDEPGQHLAELAHHAISGSDFEKGLSYARLAGDRALSLLAYEEAANLYETALGALDISGAQQDATRCELLLSLGEARSRAGTTRAAKSAFLAAADIARDLRLFSQLARAAAGYAGRVVWARAGEDARLVALLEEALAVLPGENVELRARLLARLAGALRDEPSRDRRDTLGREALDLARRMGDPNALVYALDGCVAAIFAPDSLAECVALSSELCEIAERLGDAEKVASGHFLRYFARLALGEVAEAEADLAAMSRIANELRQPALLWQVQAAQAMRALGSGRLSDGEQLMRQAFARGEPSLGDLAHSAYFFQLHTLNDLRQSLDEVEATLRDSVARHRTRPVFRCALIYLEARLGRTTDAKRGLDDLARAGFSALPFDMEWLLGMSLLAETAALLGEIDSASALYSLLLPWAALNVADTPEAIRGSVSRYLALLATTLRRFDDAQRHFDFALQMNNRMGACPWLAHTQADYARMLLVRASPGDGERAEALIGSAVPTYRQLGMESHAARLQS
jgi:predicted ATPase/DNA-binding SARP family transcriptional activator